MITNVDDLLGLPTNIPDGTFTNAEQIQGVPVDNTNIGNGKVLAYNSTDDKLEYVVGSTGGAGGGSPIWGNLTGTLSNQTDLQVALDTKANTTHTHTIENVTGLQTALNSKVDKVVGKGLSTNDLTNELKEQYDQAVTNKHTHINKTLLDSIIDTGLGTKYLSDNGTYKEVQGGSGVDTFVELTDTPNSYIGQEGKFVRVNPTATALEFIEGSGSGGVASFTQLNDVPYSYIGQANKFVQVKSDESGLEFLSHTIPTKTSDLTNDSNFVVDSSYVHTDNNYTTTEKTKLSGIQSGAEVNVNADWNSVSGDSKILNKPSIIDNALTLTNPTTEYVIKNNSLVESSGGGSGASTFIELSDTPSSYSGEGGKVVSVKSDGTGLEFTTPSGGASEYPKTMFKPMSSMSDFASISDSTGRTGSAVATLPSFSTASWGVFITKLGDTVYDIQFNLPLRIAGANITTGATFSLYATINTGLGTSFTPSNAKDSGNKIPQIIGSVTSQRPHWGGSFILSNGNIIITCHCLNQFNVTKSTFNFGLQDTETWLTGRGTFDIRGATPIIPLPTL